MCSGASDQVGAESQHRTPARYCSNSVMVPTSAHHHLEGDHDQATVISGELLLERVEGIDVQQIAASGD